MLYEIMNAHQTELRTAGRKIERRMEWEQLSRIERLERALKNARVRLHVLPNLSAKAN